MNSSNPSFPNRDDFNQIHRLFPPSKPMKLERYSGEKVFFVEEEQFRDDLHFVTENVRIMEINDMVKTIHHEYSNDRLNSSRNFWRRIFGFPLLGFILGLICTYFLIQFMSRHDPLISSDDPAIAQNIPTGKSVEYAEIPLMKFLIISGDEADPLKEKIEIYYKNKQFHEALVELKSLKLASSGAFSEQTFLNYLDFYVAICELKLGHLEKGRIIFENLSQSQDFDLKKETDFYLGIVHFFRDDFELAKKYLSKTQDSGRVLIGGRELGAVSKVYLEKISDNLN